MKKLRNSEDTKYIFNGYLHERIDHETWKIVISEAKEHNMSKSAYVRYKLGIPLKPGKLM